MYAALTPNLYLGEPPFAAIESHDPLVAAAMVKQGWTVWVGDTSEACATLHLLDLTPDEVYNAVTAARDGLTAVYTDSLPVHSTASGRSNSTSNTGSPF